LSVNNNNNNNNNVGEIQTSRMYFVFINLVTNMVRVLKLNVSDIEQRVFTKLNATSIRV